MKKDVISKALDYIDNSYIREAAMLSPDRKGGEENKEVKKIIYTRKIIKVAIIAAALVSLFAVTAFAAALYINSPEQAVKVAQQELNKMQEMGLIAEGMSMSDEPDYIGELQEETKNAYFFGRILKHRYTVRDFDGKYMVELTVDTATGKASRVNLKALGDESDEVVGVMEMQGTTFYYYDNFDDLFRTDITIDEFCTLLAEYWGFSGYTLSGTEDSFYDYDTDVPSGDTLLRDICDGPYLTVYFEGDQSGVPMFIEMFNFPAHVYLGFGTGHLIG